MWGYAITVGSWMVLVGLYDGQGRMIVIMTKVATTFTWNHERKVSHPLEIVRLKVLRYTT